MSKEDLVGTTIGQSNAYLQRAYALNGVDAVKELYEAWANNYDSHLQATAYQAPKAAVDALLKHLPSGSGKNITILDTGCGTGLVGMCLKSARPEGWAIDGVDLTPGMLAVAEKKGIYRFLTAADLNQPLTFEDGSYDAVMCVGTLTKGHVGPTCLGEFVRVVKDSGGLVVATVHDDIWASGDYKAEVEKLEGEGKIYFLGTEGFSIIAGGDKQAGRMVVLKRR